MTDEEKDKWREEHGSKLITDYCCKGFDCCFFGDSTPEEPCWGVVSVIDEICYGDDYNWIHCCEGHEVNYLGNGKYFPFDKDKK